MRCSVAGQNRQLQTLLHRRVQLGQQCYIVSKTDIPPVLFLQAQLLGRSSPPGKQSRRVSMEAAWQEGPDSDEFIPIRRQTSLGSVGILFFKCFGPIYLQKHVHVLCCSVCICQQRCKLCVPNASYCICSGERRSLLVTDCYVWQLQRSKRQASGSISPSKHGGFAVKEEFFPPEVWNCC